MVVEWKVYREDGGVRMDGAENIGRGWENYDVQVTGKDWMEE